MAGGHLGPGEIAVSSLRNGMTVAGLRGRGERILALFNVSFESILRRALIPQEPLDR
jgi:hypothetical protein